MTSTTPTRLAAALAALAATAALAFAGCGSSSDDETSATDSTTSDARAALIAEGDQICTEASKKLDAAVQERLKEIGGRDLKNEDLVTIFKEVTIPGLEQLQKDLAALQPPPEDAEQYQEILDALDKAIDEAKKDPEKLAVFTGDKTPFDEANKLESEFGFQVCGGGDAQNGE